MYRVQTAQTISIHALREEGDYAMIWQEWFRDQFLSTPSARRATRTEQKRERSKPFLSTPSARRATTSALPSPQKAGISIHALREEGDPTL